MKGLLKKSRNNTINTKKLRALVVKKAGGTTSLCALEAASMMNLS